MRNKHWMALLFILLLPASAQASVEALLADDQLRVRSWLGGDAPYTGRAMLPLYIEVASAQRFARGSRVLRLEIPGTIVLQRERFAVNSTRWEDGRQWAVQLWTVALYPQRSGELFVPAQQLQVSVTQEDGNVVAGTVTVSALQSQVQWPEGLNGENDWVATPALTLSQNLDRDIEGLKKGDVLRRVIDIEAEDVAAMMLPGFIAEAQPGLAVYQKAPQLSDSSNRGIYRARRREVISYVLEREGQYELPSVSIQWWDSGSQALREEVLPAMTLTAGAVVEKEKTDAWSLVWLGAGLLLSGLAAAAYFAWTRWQQTPSRRLYRELQQACLANDVPAALALFYRWLDGEAPEGYAASVRQWLQGLATEKEDLALFEQLMAAYAREPRPNAAVLQQLLQKLRSENADTVAGQPDLLRLN